jgi:negative regulator of flagellin synthesis FlgM
MKVTLNSIDKINSEFIQKDLKRVKDTEKDSENIVSEDKVEISSKALDLKAMQEQAMQAPDVRMDMIASIKTRLDSGTYEINHEQIAERMVEDSLTG